MAKSLSIALRLNFDVSEVFPNMELLKCQSENGCSLWKSLVCQFLQAVICL